MTKGRGGGALSCVHMPFCDKYFICYVPTRVNRRTSATDVEVPQSPCSEGYYTRCSIARCLLLFSSPAPQRRYSLIVVVVHASIVLDGKERHHLYAIVHSLLFTFSV